MPTSEPPPRTRLAERQCKFCTACARLLTIPAVLNSGATILAPVHRFEGVAPRRLFEAFRASQEVRSGHRRSMAVPR